MAHVVLSTRFMQKDSYQVSVKIQETLQGARYSVYNPNTDMPKCHDDKWKEYFMVELEKASKSRGFAIRIVEPVNGAVCPANMLGRGQDDEKEMIQAAGVKVFNLNRVGMHYPPPMQDWIRKQGLQADENLYLELQIDAVLYGARKPTKYFAKMEDWLAKDFVQKTGLGQLGLHV
jgi:hypothetical protein